MRRDIHQSNIRHSNQRLRITMLIQRINHTPRPIPARLLLLLRAYVDVPPDGEMDEDVGVDDGGDLTA